MKKPFKAKACGIFLLAVLESASPVAAAETELPVSAKIIRCVTEAEREQQCLEQNICCQLQEIEERIGDRAEDSSVRPRVADRIAVKETNSQK